MKHKGQHTVQESYLRAWVDTNTPQGQEPYVWLFDKQNLSSSKKAPKNILKENDFYTIYDGENRNLKIELGLNIIETEFIKLRRKILENGLSLSSREQALLATFAGVTYSRTTKRDEKEKERWSNILDHLEKLSHATGFPIENHEELIQLAKKPMPRTIGMVADIFSKNLLKMHYRFICAPKGAYFITTDNPCIMVDPDAFARPGGVLGMCYPNAMILLPLTPSLVISYSWGKKDTEYIECLPSNVLSINTLLYYNAHKYLVSCNPNPISAPH